MKTVGRILGTIWCLPITLFALILAACFRLKFLYFEDWVLFFVTVPKSKADSLMHAGTSLCQPIAITIGQCVLIRDDVFSRKDWCTPEELAQLKAHEKRHVWQQWVMGIFQPIAYGVHYLILLAQKKDAYHDNFLERDARRAAGESVD